MRRMVASRIMVRTTLNLDPTVLDELRERAVCEGLPLGVVASRLLADALREVTTAETVPFTWHSEEMGKPFINLDDRDAVLEFLDRETFRPR